MPVGLFASSGKRKIICQHRGFATCHALSHDISAWLVGLYKPTKEIRVRVRGRYRFEDIFDNTYLEQTLAMDTDVSMKVRRRDTVRVRFDANFFLDDRASTAVRSPNPELSLWLGYEARY